MSTISTFEGWSQVLLASRLPASRAARFPRVSWSAVGKTFSREDPHKQIEQGNDPELQKALQELVDHPALFDVFDTAQDPDGKPYGKISTGDLRDWNTIDGDRGAEALKNEPPLTEDDRRTIELLHDSDDLRGIFKKGGSHQDLEDAIEKHQEDWAQNELWGAEHLRDTDYLFDLLDRESAGGQTDGQISRTDLDKAMNHS